MSETVHLPDLRVAAEACLTALAEVLDRDWSVRAVDLNWSCQQTLDHIPNTLVFYASHLALPAKEKLPRTFDGGDRLSIPELLLSVEVTAAILEHIIHGSPESTRALHPA